MGSRTNRRVEVPDGSTVYTYFILGEVTGNVKIGISKDLKQRFTDIKVSCPDRLSLVGVMKGGRELERTLHYKFRHLHLHGEWFAGDEELVLFIGEEAAEGVEWYQEMVDFIPFDYEKEKPKWRPEKVKITPNAGFGRRKKSELLVFEVDREEQSRRTYENMPWAQEWLYRDWIRKETSYLREELVKALIRGGSDGILEGLPDDTSKWMIELAARLERTRLVVERLADGERRLT